MDNQSRRPKKHEETESALSAYRILLRYCKPVDLQRSDTDETPRQLMKSGVFCCYASSLIFLVSLFSALATFLAAAVLDRAFVHTKTGARRLGRMSGGAGDPRRPCKFFLDGRCRHGNSCKFSHDVEAALLMRAQQQQRPQQQQQQQRGGGQAQGRQQQQALYKPSCQSEYFDTHVHMDIVLQKEFGVGCFLDKSVVERFFQERCPGPFGGAVTVAFTAAMIDTVGFLLDVGAELFKAGKVKWRLYGTFGIHPHHAKDWNPVVADRVVDAITRYREAGLCVGLGECGLDYFVKPGNRELLSPADVQRSVFAEQCRLASALEMPLVLHVRDAEEDALPILKECLPKNQRIHVHCFTGKQWFVDEVLKEFPNAFFGFTGVITFPHENLNALREVVRLMPPERLLLETDGPYMTPEPFRKHVACPAHIPLVAETVASLRGENPEAVLTQCRMNAMRMYGV
uniref:C3H1-type domain-containing protein n=1 Tax=Chromera velia CCMP2878 TaxID=1169474 RepID=A0A0G4GGY1_9ALVE|eukprot:Cvel_21861.t1-p1 / transcript=Cvel_21861.t1 / gene=Cvel_21861 / organism=Chromera_velia_CCMP2878 / gene_product=Putative deoxyribonuclease TATDN2, putative / transcript_product=Putative deoxyribonuclease TATDN2, putative / location=Cvel_scaffold2089:26134-29182(-) / protein_length=456 / sequence_SO=supercontig / SO=protein_coding / is_pseudo=false